MNERELSETWRAAGSYGYASAELDELVGDDGYTWSFGPLIDLPLFDFGRRRGNLTVAEARESIAIANYEHVIQAGFQEVSDALAGRRFLAEQVAAQERGTLAQRGKQLDLRRRLQPSHTAIVDPLGLIDCAQ